MGPVKVQDAAGLPASRDSPPLAGPDAVCRQVQETFGVDGQNVGRTKNKSVKSPPDHARRGRGRALESHPATQRRRATTGSLGRRAPWPARNDHRRRRANDEFFTIADTGFCALDLIYDATDRATFDDRLRAALPGLQPKTKLYQTRGANWNESLRAIGDVFECAASLRALLVHARPATPADLAVPNVPASRTVSAAGLQEAHDRAQAARDLLGLRCTFLDSLLKAEVHDAAQLRPALEALAAFGLVAPLVEKNQLAFVAQAALAAGQRRLENADVALARSLEAEAIWQAGQAVFGEGFWIFPAIDPPAGADSWSAALVVPPPGATTTAVRTCLTDVAAVREGARRFLEATLLTEATGGTPAWQVAQVTGIGGPRRAAGSARHFRSMNRHRRSRW